MEKVLLWGSGTIFSHGGRGVGLCRLKHSVQSCLIERIERICLHILLFCYCHSCSPSVCRLLPQSSRASTFQSLCLLENLPTWTHHVRFLSQLFGFKGVEYSSPTLSSAIGNLTPAFTFMLAIIFRLEKLILTSSSTQAKITGTFVSISGAFLVVLYKGPIIWNTSSPSKIPYSLGLSQSNWAIGGIFLAADYLLRSMIFVVQAQIMKVYPAELVVVFLLNLCATIISAPVCLIADMNFSDWKTTTGISLAAILYSGIMGYCFGTIVHTWGVRVKGPVYVALFKPFSIVIAAVTGFIFLGESLYLGSVVGAVVISVGFYVVMWGKAKEEKGEEFAVINSLESPYTPLLGEER
ncbi:WAT1-related protein At5g40230-like isoform X3 [Actinidia eriantha]|uniref:WAT1-related protein At5g40230-like isoform X3 n=1 Tax=Actinidia eriantha TaxID=165200 RepID=UPI002586C699|nr:WAT1-related protein At5g40230-like isoform X3 [Actinidia eriantha]